MPKGLGRGLNALMGEDTSAVAPLAVNARGIVRDIPLTEIDTNPHQPRTRFDENALKELAQSIGESGVITPVLVYERLGRYTLIAGERRFRASRMAGLNTIPALIRDYSEIQRMEIALIENIQRADLNPIEEALAIRALMDECGATQEIIAQKLGRSRPAVANLLRILTLPDAIIALVRSGELSTGHARALVSIDDRDRQISLAKQAVTEGWSVRQMESALKTPLTPRRVQPKAATPPELTDMQSLAMRAFGTKAEVDGTLYKGRLVLHYYNREDLERIYELLKSLEG